MSGLARNDSSPVATVDVCISCGAPDALVFDLPYPLVRQSDFTNIKDSAQVAECPACGCIRHCVDDEDVARIESQFGDDGYGETNQTGQVVPIGGAERWLTRCALQARMLAALVKNPRAVLDIGCFDGELLTELHEHFPSAELHGQDTAGHMRRRFPQGEPYRFWAPRLEDVRGSFDLICISHTLMYVRDLRGFMTEVDRLLSPGGLVFLQMPDVTANPCSLLMGDQYHYFSTATVAMVLRRFRFDVDLVANPWFPREIVAVAHRSATHADSECRTDRSTVSGCLATLAAKARALRGLSHVIPTHVLGVTFTAAFVDNILGSRVARFVDETPGSHSRSFRSKPVVRPRCLQPSDVLIIPYGASGAPIQERFTRDYRGRTIVV